MRKIGCILLIVIAVVVVFGMMTLKARLAAQAGAKKAPDATVKRGDLALTVMDTGTIAPYRQVEVKSRVEGLVSAIYVKEGDYVQAGQIVALIDPQETKLQVAQGQAQLKGAQSNVDKARIQLEQTRLTDQQNLASAEAQLKQAKINMTIQPALTKAAIDQAQANLKSAKDEQSQLLENTIPTLQASTASSLAEAKANLANTQAQLKRDQDLVAKGYVSKKAVEDDQLANSLSIARLNTAKENSDRLGAQITAQKAKAAQSVEVAQAALATALANKDQVAIQQENYKAALANKAKAEAAMKDVPIMEQSVVGAQQTTVQLNASLEDSQRLLGYTAVKAPISGIVTKKEIQVGELVSSLSSFSSGTPILLIEDRTPMLVKMSVNEIDVAKMKLGMKADVTVDAYPGKTFEGKITKIDPSSIDSTNEAATSSTTTTDNSTAAVVDFNVEVTLDGEPKELRSGMSAKCSIVSQRASNVLYIPIEDLGKDKDGSFIMVQTKSAQAGKPAVQTRVPVTTGLSTGTYVEILSGAAEGETLARPKFTGPAMQGAMEFGDGG